MASSLRLEGNGSDGPRVLWESDERVFCAAWWSEADDQKKQALAVLPASGHLTSSAPGRFTREFELKDELESAWALRPLEFVREGGRTFRR